MKYLGGKYRIAKHIERLVLEAKGDRTDYVEPFVGGAATFSKVAPHFATARGYDLAEDLVLMWQEAIKGWVPPNDVSRETYEAMRAAKPSALRGFVGFGCSFGGIWFGSYGHQKIAGGKPATETNSAGGSSRAVVRQSARMKHASIALSDYRDVLVTPNSVVYCDPPYAGTTSYPGIPPFDSAEFWKRAEAWASKGAAVLVSEYVAPAPWVKVWERAMPAYIRGGGKQKPGQVVEGLFVLPELATEMQEQLAEAA